MVLLCDQFWSNLIAILNFCIYKLYIGWLCQVRQYDVDEHNREKKLKHQTISLFASIA